jgi:UDP-N-acetylmuramoyl-L-alanyl-D-glutamate--2,6-diaminopimelate ligase
VSEREGARLARPVVEPRSLRSLAAFLGIDVPAQVAAAVSEAAAGEAAVVTGVTLDSRQVLPGDLYAALPGAHAHGAEFAEVVAAAGAAGILTDPAGRDRAQASGLPTFVVDDVRSRVGQVAAWVYGRPADHLLLVGVTGTNGKTTVSYLVEAGLRAAGHVTGLVGTVETRVAGQVVPSERTTPEAPDVQTLLALMVERGCTAAAMEVSSHALALGRVDGISFDVAVFTNLTQDHLDFHPTFEEYFRAKASLFSSRRSRLGVVNVDDEYGRRLVRDAQVPVTTYSSAGEPADWQARDVDLRADGSSFRVVGPTGERAPGTVRLPGGFNVSNALAAIVALHAAGVPLHAAVAGVGALPGVPGRMERVDAGQEFLALVDYAHTPDAVATLLDAVRMLVPGRVILVLGCGGDRDPYKRPLMGAAAVLGSDLAILTTDNPRSEDPLAILDAMSAGATGAAGAAAPPGRWQVEPDRRAAIEAAVRAAGAGDVVVVAGKGHELGQETAGVVRPFDDRVELRGAIEQLAVAP